MSIARFVLALAVLAIATASSRASALDRPLFVFVANGSGGSTSLTDGLGTAVKHAGVPMAMKTVYWCRRSNARADHADHVNQLAAAEALAGEVLAVKHQCPTARVVLVGHSSGVRVVLAAAEQLPAGTLERLILFASSVNSYYDVRPALCATRLGIDSFHSIHDGLLDTIGESIGTADGVLSPAAGVTGFALPFRHADPGSFRGLRQYGWNPELGIAGTHYSWAEPAFLYRWVVPMLMTQ